MQCAYVLVAVGVFNRWNTWILGFLENIFENLAYIRFYDLFDRFEYFNFRTEAPYTVDYISIKSGLLDANLTRPDGVMSLGTIRSEFNKISMDDTDM